MASNKGSLIPVSTAMVDKDGTAVLLWIQFFQQLLNGDPGTVFSPQFVGLTIVGQPTLTGVYYENQGFIDFFARIVPGVDTSAVAGTSYLELPFQPTSDCAAFTTTGNNSVITGISASQKRAWLPTWTNITSPITVSGRVPIRL